ncbi:hypothetical protein AMAG_13046 [Allomyces macrogynus ATCC 38327]|uniref:Uncharacterized protein n=1 Tax=Allomyces macrogynus (strain ATCC 38327) TaxID=578462 RepID=A0A0L0T150_ALLM3|nr:hypothetical protein AMAG_13046 [Allomyces macrogynus ATCC 38327]|eukprot:KNE68390.1 hypothetical protein AMAG_13046 [Allomyces macrogynus ATCC 38327]
MPRCVLHNDENLQDYYVCMFKCMGFHSGICGYHVCKINFDNELLLLVKADVSCHVIKVPLLLMMVRCDLCFLPTMGVHQGQFLPKLTVKLAGHWVNQEQPKQVIDHIWSWLQWVNVTKWGGAIYKVKL